MKIKSDCQYLSVISDDNNLNCSVLVVSNNSDAHLYFENQYRHTKLSGSCERIDFRGMRSNILIDGFSCHSIDFFDCDNTSASIEKSAITNVHFLRSTIHSVELKEANLHDIHFDDCAISEISIYDGDIQHFRIEVNKLLYFTKIYAQRFLQDKKNPHIEYFEIGNGAFDIWLLHTHINAFITVNPNVHLHSFQADNSFVKNFDMHKHLFKFWKHITLKNSSSLPIGSVWGYESWPDPTAVYQSEVSDFYNFFSYLEKQSAEADHADAVIFFIAMQQAYRTRVERPFQSLMILRLYRGLSLYGTDLKRPLLWLALSFWIALSFHYLIELFPLLGLPHADFIACLKDVDFWSKVFAPRLLVFFHLCRVQVLDSQMILSREYTF